MKVLFISDHGPCSNTFIRQDVEIMSKQLSTHYLCFEAHNHYENKAIRTSLVKYPSKSLKSRVRWRLEYHNLLFNWHDKNFSLKLKDKRALYAQVLEIMHKVLLGLAWN